MPAAGDCEEDNARFGGVSDRSVINENEQVGSGEPGRKLETMESHRVRESVGEKEIRLAIS